MFKIESNGQVMKQEKGETYEIWSHFGMVKQPMIIEETNDYIKYQWHKFNLDKGEYEIDTENQNPIIVDGVSYELIDGIATVPKIEPIDPVTLLGQQLAEEKIKNIQNTAIINQLGQELTNIKLQLLLMKGGM